MKKATDSIAMSYESAYHELQQILLHIQDESTPVDQLAAQIARANELIRFCSAALRATEAELEALGMAIR